LKSLPKYSIDAVNSGNAKVIFDYSNEAGQEIFIDLLMEISKSIGITKYNSLTLICQNRKLKNSSRNGGINYFHYDYFLILCCLDMIKNMSDEVIHSLLNNYSNKTSISLCMNATPRHHRLCAISLLHYIGLFSNSLVSFPNLSDSKEGVGTSPQDALSKLRNSKYKKLTFSAQYILNLLPLKIDSFTEKGNNLVTKIDYNNYINSWCSFVTETGVDSSVIRITEKSFKPLALGHPFILFNHPNSLYLVKDFGFSIFENIINQNYDSIIDSADRLDAIGDALLDFSEKISLNEEGFMTELKENSKFNINWTRNGFLNLYRKRYVEPLIKHLLSS